MRGSTMSNIAYDSGYSQFKGNNPFGSQAKMLYHLDRVQNYLNTGDCWPIFVEFNLTDICNLRCEWCISENCRGQDTIGTDVAMTFLEDFAANHGKAVTFSGGGEPTLHPDFTGLLYCARDQGLDVGLMTNGVIRPGILPNIDEVCKWVRISLDTLDHELYKQWKGVDRVDQVLQSIAELKKTKVGVNINVGMGHTVADVTNTIEQMYDKVDYIQFRPIIPRYFKQEKPQINGPVWLVLKEYYGSDPKISLSNDKLEDMETGSYFPFNACEGHVFNPVVQANGDVAACMYHPKDPRFVFGNLYKARFPTIWRSKTRKKVRETIRCVNYSDECQCLCKLTELNKFVDFLTHPDSDMDINFL